MVATYQKFHDKGFDVIGISLDQNKETLQSFVKENKMPWPQYFDGEGWDNKISSKYGIGMIPAMWLVGKDGKVVSTHIQGDLAGQVEKALKTP